MAFLDNELDKYNLSTYHIKFYMLSEGINPTEYGAVDPSRGIIIAESGVTGMLNIEELTTTSYVAINGASKNTSQTNINFTIREYAGATMMDRIYAASLALGIQNYFKVPYYIELSFLANKEPQRSDPTVIPNLTYRWPIKIIKMTADIDAGGASYNLESYHYSDSSNNSVYSNIDKAFSMPSGVTVDDVLTNLTTALNDRAKEKAATGVARPDTFEIKIDEVMGKMKLTSDIEIGTQPSRSKSQDEEDKNKNDAKVVQIDKNITLVDAINSLVASTDEYQKFIKQSEVPNEVGEPSKISQMHRINTEVIPITYDESRGEYQKLYKFNVVPFKQGSLQTGPNDAEANSKTRYQEYIDSNLLQKEYKYIFTGENDQILDFNMTFNYGWYVNMPPQGGLFTEYYSAAEGAVFSDSNKKILEIRRMISAYVKNSSTVSGATPIDDLFTTADITEQIATIDDSEQRKVLNRLVSQAKRSRLPPPPPIIVDVKTLNSRFVVDYTLDNALKAAKKENKLQLYPLTFAEDDTDSDSKSESILKNVEGSKAGGRQYVNSLFQQAFSGKSGDLISLEIKIKGDPYWLGDAQSTKSAEPTATRTGQPAIVMTLRTPEFPTEAAETQAIRSSLISGVYLVRRIDHSFGSGMFTQTLHCTIDPKININEINL